VKTKLNNFRTLQGKFNKTLVILKQVDSMNTLLVHTLLAYASE